MKQQKKQPAFDIKNLDRSAKPGDDFEQFANGSWKKANPVPSTESNWGSFTILNKENEEIKIRGIVDRLTATNGWKKGSNEQKLADMYKAYMDIEKINELGLSPIQDLLTKVEKIKNIQDWVNLHAQMLYEGVVTPLEGYVHVDEMDSSKNSVRWVQGGLTLEDKSFYEKSDTETKKIRKSLVEHIDTMFELAGLKYKRPGQTVLKFETGVASIHKTKVEMRDPVKINNPTSLEEIAKRTKAIDWNQFAKQSGLIDDVIIVHDLKYIPRMEDLLIKSDLEDLKIYSTWQILTAWAGTLPKKFKDENFRFFSTVMNGTKEQKPREVLALRTVASLGGNGGTNLLGKIYAKEFFSEPHKAKIIDMVENVREIYGDRIEALRWMGPETKSMAKKKLAKFSYKIAYPDSWEDTSGIKIDADTLIKNRRNQYAWLWKRMLKDIGKKADKTRWEMSPQTVNAYFMPPNNEVVFPTAILQPPFFNPDADDAINYGGIMAVIGHEFTHGFDDSGSQYDENGNLNVWWEEEDKTAFKNLSGAFSKYFSKLEPLKGELINGDLTLGENIADLGGITLAYYALEKSIDKNGDPGLIDGFTWQQRFFLGWAQVWRNNIKDEALRKRLQTDPHSPARFRINGPLPHFDPFYEAFDVKPGDKMYLAPEKRIVIW